MFWKKPSIKDLLPSPTKAEHGEYSMIFSARDQPAVLTPQLLSLSLRAIENAASIDLGEICLRNRQAKEYGNLWPGEHYRLLAGFMLALRPSVVIEIGTSTGLSALCLKKYLPPEGKLVTFDVIPWNHYSETLLNSDDFKDQKLVQYVADLYQTQQITSYLSSVKAIDKSKIASGIVLSQYYATCDLRFSML